MRYVFSILWFLGFRIAFLISEILAHLALKTHQMEESALVKMCVLLDIATNRLVFTLGFFFLLDLLLIHLKRQKLNFAQPFLKRLDLFLLAQIWLALELARHHFATLSQSAFLQEYFTSMLFFALFSATKLFFSARSLRKGAQ